MSPKTIICTFVFLGILYYGWPIFEAIILILPLPDPKSTVDNLRNLLTSIPELLFGLLTMIFFSNNNSAK